MINSTVRSDILVFNCYLCHVSFLLTCYVCSTKIGEISDISKCFENFVSQKLGVLTRIYAAELRHYRILLKLLKDSVITCSTRDRDIEEYEWKGEVIIKTLYDIYSDPRNKDAKLLPPSYRGGASLKENSINYIAGMMDTFAISMFEEHTGVSFDKIDFSKKI